MIPTLAISDVANRPIADAELSTDGRQRQSRVCYQATNDSHIRIGQLSFWMGHAERVALFSMAIGIVLALRASKQVVGVHARRVVAFVKHAQARLQRSMGSLKHESRSAELASVMVAKNTVALSVSGTEPQPAFIWRDIARHTFQHAHFKWNGAFGCFTASSRTRKGAERFVLRELWTVAKRTCVHFSIIRRQHAVLVNL